MRTPFLMFGARVAAALLLILMTVTPVAAEETGAATGEVVFRVTLSGPVDEADGFAVWSRCPDEWCQVKVIADGPVERPVVACGRGFADAPTCEATTYEWTVDLVAGTLEYRFERVRDVAGANETQVLATGTWNVHTGRQVLTFEYAYPSATAAPRLPDTALAAPVTDASGHRQ